MEEQAAFFLVTLFQKPTSLATISDTMDHLIARYELDKSVLMDSFDRLLQARPDPVFLHRELNNMLLCAPLQTEIDKGLRLLEFQRLFHPVSITEAHETPDSFTAVRIFKDFLITASDDGAVKLFSEKDGILTLESLFICLFPHKRQISNMVVSEQMLVVVWGSVMGVWDLESYNGERYVFSKIRFVLRYAVREKSTSQHVLVKDNADELYIPVIDGKHYILAQTTTSILLFDIKGQRTYTLFKLGSYEREDKQKINWASYSQASKMIVFVFEIRHKLLIGFINISKLDSVQFCAMYEKHAVFSSDCCGSHICFTSILPGENTIYNKSERIEAEVVMIDPDGKHFAVSFRNLSCVLYYDMPHLQRRSVSSRIDYTFVDLRMNPRVFDLQNVHVPALLKAQSPKYTVENLLFTTKGRILVCELKLESRQFDKSFLLFFDCNTGKPVSRCILQGTGCGIAMALININNQAYIVVSDAENTGKDALNRIQLGPRDTFVYLLEEDGNKALACAHFPNGQEEDQMVFCDIFCHKERCYCTNACGEILVIGPDQLSEDRIDKEIMPEEQFFMIELPAFHKLRYALDDRDANRKEVPGKLDLGISNLLNVASLPFVRKQASGFGVGILARTADGSLLESDSAISEERIVGFELTGNKLDVLKTFFCCCMNYKHLQVAKDDYFFGFKFLRRANFHHNSYYHETVENLCKYRDPFVLVSSFNKVYDFSKPRIDNYKKCQSKANEDFFNCIEAKNDFSFANEPRSHIIGVSGCKQFGLLRCENFTQFVIDPNSQSYILHEGVNYKNKNQDEQYQVVFEDDIRIFEMENYNIYPTDQNYNRTFEFPKFEVKPDPEESADDLKEESETSESAVLPPEVIAEESNSDYFSYSETDNSINLRVEGSRSESAGSSSSESVSAANEPLLPSAHDELGVFQESAFESSTQLEPGPKRPRSERIIPPFQQVQNWNHSYIQSYNSCTTSQYNQDLMSSSVVRTGDVIFLNSKLLALSTKSYRDIFSSQVYNTLAHTQASVQPSSGIYIVKSVYSRLAPHTQKVYENKKINYPQNFVVVQDIELAPCSWNSDAFLSSGANELYDPFLLQAFDRFLAGKDELNSKESEFITIFPLSRSSVAPMLHPTAGLVPIRNITRLKEFASGEEKPLFYSYDYLPETSQIPDHLFNDISWLLQHNAERQVDSYILTYYPPVDRKFSEYARILTKEHSKGRIHEMDEVRVCSNGSEFSARTNSLRIGDTSKSIVPPTSFISELGEMIGKILNNSLQRVEVCPQFEVFNRDWLDSCKHYTKYSQLVVTAWAALTELLTHQNICALLSFTDLEAYLSHFYGKLEIRDIQFILEREEIFAYQNQKIDVIVDNYVALFEQSMSETRRCNQQEETSLFEQIGILSPEDSATVLAAFENQDLEAITQLQLRADDGQHYLTELQTSQPAIPIVQDNSFTENMNGSNSLAVEKSVQFSQSLYNRVLLYFALVRALEYSAAQEKTVEHIQNYFLTPVFLEDYLEKIASPVWLNLILERIISGFYQSYLQMINDIEVIAANSQIFNEGDNEVYVDQVIALRTDVFDEMNRLIAYLFSKDEKTLEECCKIDFEEDDSVEQKSESAGEEEKPVLIRNAHSDNKAQIEKSDQKSGKNTTKKGKVEDSFVDDASDYSISEYTLIDEYDENSIIENSAESDPDANEEYSAEEYEEYSDM